MSIDYTDGGRRGKGTDDEVLLTTSFLREDDGEGRLRPQTLADYHGQGESQAQSRRLHRRRQTPE